MPTTVGFIQYKHRVPDQLMGCDTIFRCPDNLLVGRSFLDPSLHFLSRFQLWHGSSFTGAIKKEAQPILYSKSQLKGFFKKNDTITKIIVARESGGIGDLFLWWFSNVIIDHINEFPEVSISVVNSCDISVKRNASRHQEADRCIGCPDVIWWNACWENFCNGELNHISMPPVAQSGKQVCQISEGVLQSIRMATETPDNNRMTQFDHVLMSSFSSEHWTMFSTVASTLTSACSHFSHLTWLRRAVEISLQSTPSVLGMQIDHQAKSLLSGVEFRLTELGMDMVNGSSDQAVSIPEMWIGGFSSTRKSCSDCL